MSATDKIKTLYGDKAVKLADNIYIINGLSSNRILIKDKLYDIGKLTASVDDKTVDTKNYIVPLYKENLVGMYEMEILKGAVIYNKDKVILWDVCEWYSKYAIGIEKGTNVLKIYDSETFEELTSLNLEYKVRYIVMTSQDDYKLEIDLEYKGNRQYTVVYYIQENKLGITWRRWKDGGSRGERYS